MNKLSMPVLLALSLGVSPVLTQAAVGELWDVKMKMTGLGIDMPATQMCMSKDKINEKDVQTDDECRTTSFKNLSPNHVKFSFTCKDGSSGDGDIQRDSRSFKQTMNMLKDGEKMTMTSDGTNTGKACDPDAGKKQVAATMGQQCEAASKNFDSYGVIFPQHKDPEFNCDKYQSAYCGLVKSTARKMNDDSKVFNEKAFAHNADAQTLAAYGSWQKAVTTCGAGKPDDIQKNACKHALNTENWQMANTYCKSELAALQAKECTGRSYTAINSKYRTLCGEGGRAYTADSNSKKKPLEDMIPGTGNNSGGGDMLDKAKKLKDVFGF